MRTLGHNTRFRLKDAGINPCGRGPPVAAHPVPAAALTWQRATRRRVLGRSSYGIRMRMLVMDRRRKRPMPYTNTCARENCCVCVGV